MARRYNVWAANPKGFPEREGYCIAEVSDGHGLFYQCQHTRKYGDFCGVHERQRTLGRTVLVPGQCQASLRSNGRATHPMMCSRAGRVWLTWPKADRGQWKRNDKRLVCRQHAKSWRRAGWRWYVPSDSSASKAKS